uniref:Uncharacterized protein n=1 Tax=Arundo donax TaxID=35708 RepID=A0A0A9AU28_ARUDO
MSSDHTVIAIPHTRRHDSTHQNLNRVIQ